MIEVLYTSVTQKLNQDAVLEAMVRKRAIEAARRALAVRCDFQ
jgi:hypothetical protein